MLNIHSKYSLKYGLKSPREIIDWAIANGYRRVVLTDINHTGSALSFVQYAQQNDYTPAVGVDVRNGIKQCYVIIAQNNRGFHEMNVFLSKYLNESFPPQPDFLPNCYVIYPWSNHPDQLRQNERIGVRYVELRLQKVMLHPQLEEMVALHTMTFGTKRDYNVHRLLRAIDKNVLLSKLPTEEIANQSDCFIDFSELKTLYKGAPYMVKNAEQLLRNCGLSFSFGEDAVPQNMITYTGSKIQDRQKIEVLCKQGVKERYPAVTEEIKERIEREINMIEQKGYLAYFLVTWDIISYAKSKKYPHVGRGSGANSIVAYLLGITDVDPLELDLYFERFINLYRKNPPDFDIDFSWTQRDEIIDYIFQRYPSAALLCTYNTFQYRATLRELGKVFGLPKDDIDKLIVQGLNVSQKTHQTLDKYCRLISGLPNYLSIHAGGIVIPEKPISWFSAYFIPPKGYPTTQFSMLEAEDVGLYKFDILSQRGLSKIQDALTLIQKHYPEAKLPKITNIKQYKEDKRIKKILQGGDAMGCFYVESPAMRMLMKKLSVSNYIELVAASSIIRPGVSSSGMMQEYILRHKDPERRKQVHPVLLGIMPETYGVMVYQEDVIKVAHHFAGLSLDEADILRRGMSGKYRSRKEFEVIRDKFYANCRAKQYEESLIAAVWYQIESFAGYAFSKGHSASFAVESFQSLYLKAYYPIAYMLATVNNGGGYYRTEVYLEEAKRHGAIVHAPCIEKSDWLCRLEGSAIYIGLGFIQGMKKTTVNRIFSEREREPFLYDLHVFIDRANIGLEQLLLLIRINAFRSWGISKKDLLWKAHLHFKQQKKQESAVNLFSAARKQIAIPPLEEDSFEQAFEELELLGFSSSGAFALLDKPLAASVCAKQFAAFKGGKVECYGYLISVKKTTTANGEHMFFGHFYDPEGGRFDTVHFPASAKQYPFRGIGVYALSGVITEEFGFYTLEVDKMERLNMMRDVRYG
jgi:DNA-directed DNA polymerase III PolC